MLILRINGLIWEWMSVAIRMLTYNENNTKKGYQEMTKHTWFRIYSQINVDHYDCLQESSLAKCQQAIWFYILLVVTRQEFQLFLSEYAHVCEWRELYKLAYSEIYKYLLRWLNNWPRGKYQKFISVVYNKEQLSV